MTILSVDAQQASAITGVAAKLDDAFSDGVQQTGAPPTPVLPAAVGFDKLPSVVKTAVKAITQSTYAAMVKQNAGLSVTVSLAKLTGGGSNGSLTFVNGILTAKVDPS